MLEELMTTKEAPDRIDDIAQAAEQQAEQLLTSLGISVAPIDPIAIAKRLGYSVNGSIFRNPDLSGRVQVRDGRVRIDVNASEAPNRARFTIAHEIAHAVLHLADSEHAEMSDFLDRRKSKVARAAKETEADAFAAALLMPEALVRDRFKLDAHPDILAKFFQVSLEAMKIRLEKLHLSS